MNFYNIAVFIFLFLSLITTPALGNICLTGEEICKWINKVRIVKTDNITASAVHLSNKILVTNKHVVEDNISVQVVDANGLALEAFVLPNGHSSDLVLLSIDEKNAKSINLLNLPKNLDNLRGVAYGVGRGKIRVFPEGDIISYPPENLKQARIHTTIRNLPGISGGALINSFGELVGILTAGSGLYNESVPIKILNEVISATQNSHKRFLERGKAFRLCSNLLLNVKQFTRKPPDVFLKKLRINCDKANNKTFYDIVGQTFGRFGLFTTSIHYLQKSVSLDPNGPTSLISLAIAFQFQKSYEKQVEVLDHLLKFLQDDPLVLRMSIQAAAFANNKLFAKKSLRLLKKNNPNAYPQALDFLNNYFESI